MGVRQRQVTRCITNAIFRSMCGKNWANAEKNFAKRPWSQDSVEALETLVDKRTDFGRRLSRQGDAGVIESAVTALFAAEAGRQGFSRDGGLCDFALRLAAGPENVLTDPHLDGRVGQLSDNPALLRGARLLSLLREHRHDKPARRPNTRT